MCQFVRVHECYVAFNKCHRVIVSFQDSILCQCARVHECYVAVNACHRVIVSFQLVSFRQCQAAVTGAPPLGRTRKALARPEDVYRRCSSHDASVVND